MAASTLALVTDQYTGRTLGKYEIICRLSTGGMSLIFLAFQRGLAGFRKLVVLKQILPDIRGEEEFVRMFLDEAKITAAFNHPNIAQVFDLDAQSGELFLAMEFVPGATLVEVAKACRANNEPIPTGLTLTTVRDTALALHYAHTFTDPIGRSQTVIHRDVAEKNIMVTYEGTTKLLDFGIAKSLASANRTTVGMVKGTSGYMSPEQILGEKLDARSDVFSLGVVLHECLTGMRLFHGKSPEEGMLAALKEPVTPPSRGNNQVSRELDAVVLKALARRRDDRFANARELARAIERTAGHLLWEQEEVSALVQRLFSDRRDQTRSLLSTLESNRDVTGEHQLRQLLGEAALSEPPPPLPPPRVSGVQASIPVPTPPPPPRSSGLLAAAVPASAPQPPRRSTAGVQVSPAVTPFPGKQRPTREGAPLKTENARPRGLVEVPWEDEATAASEVDGSDGLTLPLASLPKELFDELPKPRGTGHRARVSGSTEHTVTEDTAPGFAFTGRRRLGRWVSAALFLSLMLAVFFTASFALGVHKRLGFSDTRPPVPLEPVPLVESAPATRRRKAPTPTAPVPSPRAEVEKPSRVQAPEAAAEPAPAQAIPEPTVEGGEPLEEDEEAWEAPLPPGAKASRPARPAVEVLAAREEAQAQGATGLLTLVTEPYAQVMLEAQDLGATPLFKHVLPVGKHTLRLVSPDEQTFLLPVEIREGETNALRVALDQLQRE